MGEAEREHGQLKSRRALLAGAFGSVAALAVGAIAPRGAMATQGQAVLAGKANTAQLSTKVTATVAGNTAIVGYGKGNGNGVSGENVTGSGVTGWSPSGHGVHAASDTGKGVSAYSSSGFALYGSANTGTGVYGESQEGYASEAVGYAPDYPAVLGYSYGANTGVQGYSGTEYPPNPPNKTGVYGVADGGNAAVGVRGVSSTGRGAVFEGAVAQMRLAPGSSSTHPTGGQRGDFYVDLTGRLWYCMGLNEHHLVNWKLLS